MELDETLITKTIVESFTRDFLKITDVDVVIVGAGPSGVTAARYLAEKGFSVVVFERNLYVGGGMWGGGIMFPKIVIQEAAKQILEEVGLKPEKTSRGVYVVDSVEAVSRFTVSAIEAGAKIMVGFNVEDVVIRGFKDKPKICGVVLNWTAVEKSGLHVDPVAIKSKVVVDSTGHEASVVRTAVKKFPEAKLQTKTGEIMGEKPMWVEVGEAEVVKNTCEVLPGLYVAGMAATAVFGSPRMGPIFGGMFLSGKKVAELIAEKLK
ncbi:MAG: ribose 1,5-bisphosphate isomerase [Candidatus Hecatellales archaeon]|nr:MAG: ribose 1,5-bisphosphate isomerase [Candidatus Hecatellales archaeon]